VTRAWFRRRLDADPQRWVLLLAALDGLGGYALKAGDDPRLFKSGVSAAIGLAVLTMTPALGVLAMVMHGRTLWWAGRLLRGRARPRDIHAAFAWSQLPFVIAALPLVLGIPLRTAAALMDAPPAGVLLGADLVRASSGPLSVTAGLVALWSVVLYVRFVGEAQGFGTWRAIASHLLAAAMVIALFAAGLAIGALALPGSVGLPHLLAGLAASAVLAAAIEWGVHHAAARPAPVSAALEP